ncbi:C40 family peptidase [Cryobacterium sp. PAMC25264]|uniref:C40 family peptidase n=1 Tax=Cryobacterium sp. PAMC25264 TaxID=2861288 RepID=UPI001C639677|nr:C40 family peptidase [Cryobacterium sp. PAMC25264]QYF74663.1 C40 family peptidase [Cryobacterium sp. PAMC25264]
MTLVDATQRVGEIQARLVQLNDLVAGGTGVTASKTAAATATASATSFADALAAATATSTVANAGGATGTDVVASAEKYLGVPYVFGGEDGSGMDCSGLVQRVYADLGIDVPRLVSGQMTIGTEVGSLAEARPGDLIVTGGGEHILIYAGNNQVIHAPYEGRTVCKVDAYMDDSDIDTIRRVIPDAAAAGTASSTVSGTVSGTALSATSSSSQTDLLTAAFASLFSGTATQSAQSTSALSTSALSASGLSTSGLAS